MAEELATPAETLATPEHLLQAKSCARFDAKDVDGWSPLWEERHVDFDITKSTSLKILVGF